MSTTHKEDSQIGNEQSLSGIPVGHFSTAAVITTLDSADDKQWNIILKKLIK